jgi:quercetin dioxygenase-like cupin family protein
MPETPRTFLDGRVTVQALTPDNDLAGRFSKADDRGRISVLVRESPRSFVELAEFLHPGTRRGFHLHRTYQEELFVVSGYLTVVVEEDASGNHAEFEIGAGDLLQIAPGIAHGFIAQEPSLVVAMGNQADPFKDREPTPNLVWRGAM